MPNTKRAPQRRTARALGRVVAGAINTSINTPATDETQALTEREIHDGLRHLGTVRETAAGELVAIVGEHVVGTFDTIAEATDAVLSLAGAGGGHG